MDTISKAIQRKHNNEYKYLQRREEEQRAKQRIEELIQSTKEDLREKIERK